MTYFDRYKRRVLLNGETTRDQIINEQRYILESYFADHPSYQVVFLNGSKDPIGIWIVENSTTKDTQEFISVYDTPINAGDMLLWNDWHWLATYKDAKSEIYHQGTISKCVADLKWLDDKGVIQSAYFTYRNEDLTNFGIDDGKIIVLGNERRHIYVQLNEHTKKIKKYKRFIIDNRAWKVISVDRLKQGLIYIVLQEDEIDTSKDNLELGIADYIEYKYDFYIVGGDSISINVGNSQQLVTELLINGGLTNDYEVEWVSSNPDVIEITSDGVITAVSEGQAEIIARLKNNPDIFDQIEVVVEEIPSNKIDVLIHGQESIVVGDQAIYQAIITNNGIVDNDKEVQWYLFDADGISQTTKAQLTNITSRQCIIKTKAVGTIKLKCVVIGYPTSTFEKEIKIKHLF